MKEKYHDAVIPIFSSKIYNVLNFYLLIKFTSAAKQTLKLIGTTGVKLCFLNRSYKNTSNENKHGLCLEILTFS